MWKFHHERFFLFFPTLTVLPLILSLFPILILLHYTATRLAAPSRLLRHSGNSNLSEVHRLFFRGFFSCFFFLHMRIAARLFGNKQLGMNVESEGNVDIQMSRRRYGTPVRNDRMRMRRRERSFLSFESIFQSQSEMWEHASASTIVLQ